MSETEKLTPLTNGRYYSESKCNDNTGNAYDDLECADSPTGLHNEQPDGQCFYCGNQVGYGYNENDLDV